MEKLDQIYSRPTELLSFQSTHMLCSSLHYLATHNIWLFGFFWNYFCWQRKRHTYLLPRFYLKHKLLVINFCVIRRHWQYTQHPSSTYPTPSHSHLRIWHFGKRFTATCIDFTVYSWPHAFPGNQTHDIGIACSMLHCLPSLFLLISITDKYFSLHEFCSPWEYLALDIHLTHKY